MFAPYFDYLSRDWNPASPNYDRLGVKYIVSAEQLTGFDEIMHADGLYLYRRGKSLSVFQFAAREGDIAPAPIASVEWQHNAVDLTLAESRAGLFVFAQPYYDGWKVYLDGKPGELKRHDIFMAVKLIGNEQTIKFAYAPPYVWVGAATMSLVLIGLFLSLFCEKVSCSTADTIPRSSGSR
jgi:hypothetical protein